MPTPEFEQWARQYSGVLGGNPKADLWISGIEYGGTTDNDNFCRNHIRFSHDNIPCWDSDQNGISYPEAHPDCENWQYNQKVAKIALAFAGHPIEGYKKYIREEMCRKNGIIFLMNLFPLQCRNVSEEAWQNNQRELTGIQTKQEYIEWCQKNRFPILRKLVTDTDHKPKILICTGTTFHSCFKKAFLTEKQKEEEVFYLTAEDNRSRCKVFTINDGKTKVILTPFLGQGGIMANAQLVKLAEFCRRY